MRLSRKLGKGLLMVTLVSMLAGLLTACPQVVVGSIALVADARGVTRCDDGIKVVLEIKDGSIVDDNYSTGETGATYGTGDYWVWVKPGHSFTAVFQTTRAFDQNARNETFTVKAYCMRKNAEPGLSERTFDAGMFLTEAGVVSAMVTAWDAGTDPDYTVTPPGPTIDYPHP